MELADVYRGQFLKIKKGTMHNKKCHTGNHLGTVTGKTTDKVQVYVKTESRLYLLPAEVLDEVTQETHPEMFV
jgi:hypothetical protein